MPNTSTNSFVHWFRAATPYIHAFRGKTFVLAFGGEVLTDGQFTRLAHDFNLLNSLGVRLVLVLVCGHKWKHIWSSAMR